MIDNKNIASAQSIVPIENIKDGLIIMKDGSYRAILSVESVNLALKSEQEKDSVAFAYQGFLNALEFPIQILSVSRKLDLTDYLSKVNETVRTETSSFIKIQAEEYYNFVTSLLTEANIMDKEFFVVVTYYPSGVDEAKKTLFFKKQNQNQATRFEDDKKAMALRIQQVEMGLTGMGLKSKILKSEGVSELLYALYNPDSVAGIKIGPAIGLVEGSLVSTGEEGGI